MPTVLGQQWILVTAQYPNTIAQLVFPPAEATAMKLYTASYCSTVEYRLENCRFYCTNKNERYYRSGQNKNKKTDYDEETKRRQEKQVD